jgi:hypothetical protein
VVVFLFKSLVHHNCVIVVSSVSALRVSGTQQLPSEYLNTTGTCNFCHVHISWKDTGRWEPHLSDNFLQWWGELGQSHHEHVLRTIDYNNNKISQISKCFSPVHALSSFVHCLFLSHSRPLEVGVHVIPASFDPPLLDHCPTFPKQKENPLENAYWTKGLQK